MKIIEDQVLPKEIFSNQAAPQLLAQAVRVFLANQRQGNQSALTRAEISRTRRKLYKQKGTGGARHGDRKAPIFVGGGIAFAPKPRDYSLSLPGKMKKRALYGALTDQAKNKNLHIVSGMEKLTGKTAELAKFLAQLEGNNKNLLIVTDIFRENVHRGARNLPGVIVAPVNQLSTYVVLQADKILLMEEAIETFKKLSPAKSKTVSVASPKTESKQKTKITKKIVSKKPASKIKKTTKKK